LFTLFLFPWWCVEIRRLFVRRIRAVIGELIPAMYNVLEFEIVFGSLLVSHLSVGTTYFLLSPQAFVSAFIIHYY
jgi:hypothetical protein